MHHHFFTLQSHPDVTKFEFEDGLMRTAVPDLLRAESTINHLLVDLPTERTFALGADIAFPLWNGSLLVSSTEPGEADPDRLAELLVDVATLVEHQPVMLIEHSDLETPWVGTATPASKISFVVRPNSEIDSARFAAWLREVLIEIAAKWPGTGCRAIGPLDDASGSNDATLSFWFSTKDMLDSALTSRFYAPLLNEEIVDAETTRAWSTIEHRKAPNPNSWDMPAGRIMPVQVIDTDS